MEQAHGNERTCRCKSTNEVLNRVEMACKVRERCGAGENERLALSKGGEGEVGCMLVLLGSPDSGYYETSVVQHLRDANSLLEGGASYETEILLVAGPVAHPTLGYGF